MKNKMTVCKVCNKEIATSAKVCPYCGAKQKKKKALIICIVIIVIAIIAMAGGAAGGAGSETSEVETPEFYKIGEPIALKKCELTVSKVQKETYIGNEWYNVTPVDGAIYVAIQYGYKNTSKEPLTTWDRPSVNLTSPDGVVYESDFDASTTYVTQCDIDEKVLSDLNPGLSVNAAVVFEVAKTELEKDGWFINVDGEKVELTF